MPCSKRPTDYQVVRLERSARRSQPESLLAEGRTSKRASNERHSCGGSYAKKISAQPTEAWQSEFSEISTMRLVDVEMRAIRYADMSGWLIEEFPELEAKYDSELEWWRDEQPGPHIVFGDIFVPYLRSKLRAKDEEFLQRAFRFLEELASSDDVRVREVVAFSVCEPIAGDADAAEVAERYTGPLTRSFMEEARRSRRR
jgi:hypothetical protein